MSLDRAGQWIAVIANVGVFAGFLMVAYQLHQNTLGLQSQSVYASNQLFGSSDMAMMGDTAYAAFAHALTDPEKLSPAELAQMWGYMSVTIYSAGVAFEDYRKGIISEDRWLGIRELLRHLNHPIGRIIWEAQADDFVEASGDAEFFTSVQERLDSVEPNATQRSFREMLEAIEALPGVAAG